MVIGEDDHIFSIWWRCSNHVWKKIVIFIEGDKPNVMWTILQTKHAIWHSKNKCWMVSSSLKNNVSRYPSNFALRNCLFLNREASSFPLIFEREYVGHWVRIQDGRARGSRCRPNERLARPLKKLSFVRTKQISRRLLVGDKAVQMEQGMHTMYLHTGDSWQALRHHHARP
jgi:hypothetical protein